MMIKLNFIKLISVFTFLVLSYGSYGQDIYPVKSISLKFDTIENNQHQMYIAVTQILQNNDSSRITVFGNEVWLHDKLNLSLIHPYQVVIGKTSFDIVITTEADKLIYKIDHLTLDQADSDWKDTYLKLFFKDEQRSKTVILMAQINDYVLYNIGYELK